MAARLADCDLMLCRAGAVTVSELCAAGVPALLVPLIVSTTAHQRDNAGYMAAARRGAAPAAGRADAGSAGRAAARPGPRQPCWRWRTRRARWHGRRRRRAWPTRSRGCWHETPTLAWARGPGATDFGTAGRTDMKHAVKHIHFVGVGGAGMSGIAEILHNLGYTRLGLRPGRQRHHAPAGGAGHRALHRPRRGEHRRRRGGGHLHRGQGRQPRGHRRARQPRAGGAARGDAGRADAPEAGHRHRRHAWQDDDHLAGDQRAGRGRPRPDLRHRRQARTAPAPTAAWARATTSWSRPTRATPRS